MSTQDRIRDFFQKDHAEIDQIFTALRRDIQRAIESPQPNIPGLVAQFEEFNKRLDRHIGWEEELLFPAVEEEQPSLKEGPGENMRFEHREIEDKKASAGRNLRAAQTQPDRLKTALADLNATLAILEGHNMKEEQVYYPMAEEMLSEEVVQRIMQRIRK